MKNIIFRLRKKFNFNPGKVGNSNTRVGKFTYGHESIEIKQWDEGAKLEIGNFCSIASNVTIYLGGNHRTDWITTFPFGHVFTEDLGEKKFVGHPSTKGDVIIGNDVWIGSGATILSGIKIEDGAVISANATVTKDVKAYHIVGGNPAKVLKSRFSEDIVELLIKLKWWNLALEDILNIKETLNAIPSEEKIKNLLNKYR